MQESQINECITASKAPDTKQRLGSVGEFGVNSYCLKALSQ